MAQRFQVKALKEGDVVVYDLHRGALVHEITDYSIFLRDRLQRKPITVHAIGWRLTRFWSHLYQLGKSINEVDDALLSRYRDLEFELICTDRSHRGSHRAARQSVNEKLGTVLGWLVWLQSSGTIAKDSIGTYGCRVSAEQSALGPAELFLRPGLKISSTLYYRDAGVGGTGPHVPKETFDDAYGHITAHSTSAYLANRNALFADIARTAGFRRGSICSLSIHQFQRARLEQWGEDTFPVTPCVQKLNYENTFEIPIDLALRVLHFVEQHRRELVTSLGVGASVTRDKIFLSEKTGRPIEGRSMTRALQVSMRHAGASKGKVVHALRGLFASEIVEDEANLRQAKGLDTSSLSIAQATAWKLGQTRVESLVPYVSHAQSQAARRRMAKARVKPEQDPQ